MGDVVTTGGEPGLGLDAEGRPSRVVRRYDLDAWHEMGADDVARAARRATDSLTLAIGVARRPPPASLEPLLDALTVTLTSQEAVPDDRRIVPLADPEQGFALIDAAARRCPQACIAAGQLLRQTPRLDVLAGLAAEAAVYSMLLNGGEFSSWLAERDTQRPVTDLGTPLVEVARDAARLSVSLNLPQRRNALSFAMREALYDALELADYDDTVTEIDISGAGPVFCSGGDLTEFGTATDLVAAYLVRLERAPWRLIHRFADRVTMRVHGAAVGAGVEMAAFAGHVIAVPDTFFLLPEIDMGLVPGAGGTVSVPSRIGRWRTAWLVLSGQRIDATTALRWGLVDEVAET